MSFEKQFHFYDRTKPITLIGEILVDIIEDTKNGKTVKALGGSTANVAVNCAQLGLDSHFFGSVGKDDNAAFLIKEIRKEHLTYNIVSVQSPTSIVYVDKNIFSPSPRFARSADYDICFSEKMKSVIQSSNILHFSFWPLSNLPGRETILKAVDLAKRQGITVCFDPNYHPLLDEDGHGLETLLEILPKIDVIKPSLDDSYRIFGKKMSSDEYLDLFESMGIPLIIMTLGKDGLMCRFNGDTVVLPSMADEIVDSTGAGDAFWSGLYSGFLNGDTLETSLKLGLQASAWNLRNVGANTHLPGYEGIKKIMEMKR